MGIHLQTILYFLLANRATPTIQRGFREALNRMLFELAMMILRDGRRGL